MASPKRVRAAVIGCGEISEIYLKNLRDVFHLVEVVACSDLIPERARLRAEQFGLKPVSNEDIYRDPSIEMVLNLTYPASHYEVTRDALLAGKHVYTEKMPAVELSEGEALYALAREKHLLFTAAPDTCLGGGIQTARYAIDAGMIGEAVMAVCLCPRSYQLDRPDDVIRMIHQPGGGIPFDMGGYYLHALINFFGSVRRVGGFMKTRHAARPFLNPKNPLFGETHTELSPNTMAAALEFESGVFGSLMMTSECGANAEPYIQVVGTEGVLSIHDPNDFGGKLTLRRAGNAEACTVPYTHAYHDGNYRGLGATDMAWALRNHRPPRLDAAMGLQAFEIIHKVWWCGNTGEMQLIEHAAPRPEAMPRTALPSARAEGILSHP